MFHGASFQNQHCLCPSGATGRWRQHPPPAPHTPFPGSVSATKPAFHKQPPRGGEWGADIGKDAQNGPSAEQSDSVHQHEPCWPCGSWVTKDLGRKRCQSLETWSRALNLKLFLPPELPQFVSAVEWKPNWKAEMGLHARSSCSPLGWPQSAFHKAQASKDPGLHREGEHRR